MARSNLREQRRKTQLCVVKPEQLRLKFVMIFIQQQETVERYMQQCVAIKGPFDQYLDRSFTLSMSFYVFYYQIAMIW